MKAVITEEFSTKVSRLISKAKIAKNGGIEVEFTLTTTFLKNDEVILETTGDSSYGGHQLAHPDALQAFDFMRGHIAIICDQREAHNKTLNEIEEDSEAISKFSVTGFSIGGSGDSEGVTLSGNRKLPRKRMMNLPAPFTKYMDDNDPYEYGDELSATIVHACDEVNKYLDGKIAPSAQPEIPFGEGGEEPE